MCSSQVLRRLRRDWRRKYARPLELVETFVDTSRFTGACYRAANWIEVGQTTGRTRQDRDRRLQVPPKGVWVYPLDSRFRSRLCAHEPTATTLPVGSLRPGQARRVGAGSGSQAAASAS